MTTIRTLDSYRVLTGSKLQPLKIALRCVDGIYLVDVDMKGGGAGLNWSEDRSFLIANIKMIRWHCLSVWHSSGTVDGKIFLGKDAYEVF